MEHYLAIFVKSVFVENTLEVFFHPFHLRTRQILNHCQTVISIQSNVLWQIYSTEPPFWRASFDVFRRSRLKILENAAWNPKSILML